MTKHATERPQLTWCTPTCRRKTSESSPSSDTANMIELKAPSTSAIVQFPGRETPAKRHGGKVREIRRVYPFSRSYGLKFLKVVERVRRKWQEVDLGDCKVVVVSWFSDRTNRRVADSSSPKVDPASRIEPSAPVVAASRKSPLMVPS